MTTLATIVEAARTKAERYLARTNPVAAAMYRKHKSGARKLKKQGKKR